MSIAPAIKKHAESVEPAKGGGHNDRNFFGMNGLAKRFLDIAIAASALVFLAPLLLLVAIAVRMGGGPVFYTQKRIGRGGRAFSMIKFRTMRTDADAVLQSVLDSDPAARAEWAAFQKLKNDPRITRIGRYLRISSIDELPQLVNVLIGDMSIVGQRPILLNQRDAFGVHIAGYERARPGITGLWQVRGRNSLSFEQRAIMGSEYVSRWSLLLDIKLILLTIPAILFSKHAF